MRTINFTGNTSINAVSADQLVSWTGVGQDGSKLLLPPIQRSLVWTNAKILSFWDSLLRGYPSGTMLLHRRRNTANGDEQKAREATTGCTVEAGSDDFQLFDGQQRLTAILLGFGKGPLSQRLKLWVDLGQHPVGDCDFRYQLRISSTGQPFGYKANEPNQKESLGRRYEKSAARVREKAPKATLANVEPSEIIDAKAALSLCMLLQLLKDDGAATTCDHILKQHPQLLPSRVIDFVADLEKALLRPVVCQLVDPAIVDSEEDYMRFFQRLGQGGVPLSNDELTYSIIKHHHPEVHDRMQEIAQSKAGRWANEVQLVLAALRVAKAQAQWDADTKEWQKIGRPYPAQVAELARHNELHTRFLKLLPTTPGGRLIELLEWLREGLAYHRVTNSKGLPTILLARLQPSLIDVLLLFASQWNSHASFQREAGALVAFTLHWLLFVNEPDKAAWLAYRRYIEQPGRLCLHHLAVECERVGHARRLPSREQMAEASAQVAGADGHQLRTWVERFNCLDADEERPCGDAIRCCATDGGLIRIALLWTQRDYLTDSYPDFDPTTLRDEDMPVDLDHLIPSLKFNYDWREHREHLDIGEQVENFRHHRKAIGNCLGNFRWLDASDNRARKAGEILLNGSDPTIEPERWNALINAQCWQPSHVAEFQKLIDLRTLSICEHILTESGIRTLVAEID